MKDGKGGAAGARRRAIRELLSRGIRLSVPELEERFAVSPSTIRRDLAALEDSGVLHRTHGGAVPAESVSFEPSHQEKQDQNHAHKMAIGFLAASLVNPGETLFLDTGTTTAFVAVALRNRTDITVITHSLSIAWELSQGSVPFIVAGGEYRAVTRDLVGPLAEQSLSRLHVDRAFLGCNGISQTHGFTAPVLMESQIKQQMIRAAKDVTVLADHSKMGKVTLVTFASFRDVHRVVTDEEASPSMVDLLREMGVEVLVASSRRNGGESL